MLLIDAYNVIFAAGKPKDFKAAREQFVETVESYCARAGQRARVYFDSRQGPLRSKTPHVEVIYLAAGETADSAIERDVEDTADRTAYRVVSSDREVANAARRRKVEVTASEDFLLELAPPKPPGEPRQKREGISSEEAKVWLREFRKGRGSS